MKIADFLFAFHQSLNALKLEVLLLVKLRSKGKVGNLPIKLSRDQSKPVNFSKMRLKPQNQMCRTKYFAEKKNSRVVRASASGAVDLGLIPSQANDFKIGVHSFLLDA